LERRHSRGRRQQRDRTRIVRRRLHGHRPSGGYSTTAALTFDFYPGAAEQQIFNAAATSFLLATQTVTSAVWPANALNLRFNATRFSLWRIQVIRGGTRWRSSS
jgi:hypothetical protein